MMYLCLSALFKAMWAFDKQMSMERKEKKNTMGTGNKSQCIYTAETLEKLPFGAQQVSTCFLGGFLVFVNEQKWTTMDWSKRSCLTLRAANIIGYCVSMHKYEYIRELPQTGRFSVNTGFEQYHQNKWWQNFIFFFFLEEVSYDQQRH